MSVWFTSDLHIGHRAVAYDRRYGGWPEDKSLVTPGDVEWHDATLAANWDRVVTPGDQVWVLGDLVANAKNLDNALAWIADRPGTKHFILGNHDSAHPMHREAHKSQPAYLRAFESVQTAASRRITLPHGRVQQVVLSHFPYEGDGDGRADREEQWRLRNRGTPVLHGHTHTKEKVTWASPPGVEAKSPQHYADRVLQVHVGLDAWDLTPIPLETIAQTLHEEL